MLRQRIITAAVLLAILLPAVFYPSPVPFTVAMMVVIGAAGWEWGRLNKLGHPTSLVLATVCVACCAGFWAAGWLARPSAALWVPAGAAWVLIGVFLIRAGVAGWAVIPRGLRVFVGAIALCLAWLAAVQARQIGIDFLLSGLLLVWVADVFAYFAGRAFGRRKLAPGISPNKSWEGVWGGMAGVLLLAIVWAWVDANSNTGTGSLFGHIWRHAPWLLPLAALFLAAMSVVGDLIESLIKRSAGVKDSSNLLPGHGGVLDRIDALLPTLPLVMMLYCLAA